MDKNEKSFSGFMRESITYYLKLINLFFVSLKKMWYLPVLGLFLVGYIWLFAFKNSVNGFEGRAIYSYNYLDKQFYSMLFDPLEQAVLAQDYEDVSRKLNLTPEIAEEIVSLKAENANGTTLLEKEEIEGPIYLSVVLRSKESSEKIALSILGYLNNHEYVKENMVEFLGNTTKKMEFIDKEMELLNTLKKNPNVIESIEKSSDNNIAELFTLSEEKYKEKESLTKMLKKKEAVELFSGFSLSPVTTITGFKKKLLYSLLVLGFLSVIAFVVYWYKNPASFEE